MRITRLKLGVMILTGVWTAVAPSTRADWFWDFQADPVDLSRWDFYSAPPSAGFSVTVEQVDGNRYLQLWEQHAYTGQAGTGSAFGIGFVKDEDFTDVRVGAIVNVSSTASMNYCGLGARASYVTGVPDYGIVVSAYVLHVNWEDGPANLSIDIEKVVQLQNIMRHSFTAEVPGYAHHRSYYAELDVVGSDPTYVTGRLYEYPGGPLVAQVGPMIDTSGNDDWEDPGVQDAPFPSGKSGLFGQNEHAQPVGYRVTFDDAFSRSIGPAAVAPDPPDGAQGVGWSPTLSWTEADFAVGRRVWFGPAGAMTPVEPETTSYASGVLRPGQTYQWRVDQIGPGGELVAGLTWTFTTVDALTIDDFEDYADDAGLRVVWDPNVLSPGYDPNGLNFIETVQVAGGSQAMRVEYRNVMPPFRQTFGRTFDPPQDWTADGIASLSLAFHGRQENATQPMFVMLEDAQAQQGMAMSLDYAVKADEWNTVYIPLAVFADQGVDLANVRRLILGVGDGTDPGQGETTDVLYVDDIRLHQLECFHADQIDVHGDLNGDCTVDMEDFLVLARGWLNTALAAEP